jgi:GNAT superfamily N-acetyltransferase
MVEIIIADRGQYLQPIRVLFREYLQWASERITQEFGFSFDFEAMVEDNMRELGKFMPPGGRLALGLIDHLPVGIACLKTLTQECGEIKRMYVRPEARHQGLGRLLVERLLTEAAQAGYHCIRLDSARFMQDAHRLYRKLGFQEIQPYAGSEIPPEIQHHWVFMEKEIEPGVR